jgi:predicted phage terminase large subunit-like protein
MPYSSKEEAAQGWADIIARARSCSAGAAREAVAQLGRRDLFFLLTRLLGREEMFNDWCFARCAEVQRQPDGMLDLWAREHYKSTIITFGQSIRDILNDPEITIGIFSHSRPVAKGFLAQIKHEFEQNHALKTLYPDVLYSDPKRQSPRWSLDGGLVVRRSTNPKEATVEAWGLVDGQPTGKHFRLLVYDDVVTRESVTSPEMIAKVTECWALSLNLGARGGACRTIGTRYHYNDTYKTMMDRKAAEPHIHAATADGTPDGPSVFLPQNELADKRRRMGPFVFGCQMLQNPVADRMQGFREEWLRWWQPGAASWQAMNRYILVDPAASRKEQADWTVMLVVGLGADGNYYLIDGIRDRLNLTGRAGALFRLHRTYRPLAVGYEQYGMQADIEYMHTEMDRRNHRFDITPLAGRLAKADRIRRLVPLFEGGRVYLPRVCPFTDSEGRQRDLSRELVTEEYLAFPVCGHDDMLDCLARITDSALGAHPAVDSNAQYESTANMEYPLWT